MTVFILQALILMTLAFILGASFGWWLNQHQGSIQPQPSTTDIDTAPMRGTDTAATSAPEKSKQPEASTPKPSPSTSTSPFPQPASALNSPPDITKANEPGSDATKQQDAKVKVNLATSHKLANNSAQSNAKQAEAKPAQTAETARIDKTDEASTIPAKPKAAPPTKAKSVKQEPAGAASPPDNLKQIKGIGPQIESKLNAAGITSFAQIAAWTKENQKNFGEHLAFQGRIERDDWVKQAKILAKGETTQFSKRVVKGEVSSSSETPPKK